MIYNFPNISTIYLWINKYNITEKNINNFIKPETKHKNRKITNDIITYILDYIKSNPLHTCKKIIHNIYDKFKVKLSKSSIYYLFFKHNITYKNVYKQI